MDKQLANKNWTFRTLNATLGRKNLCRLKDEQWLDDELIRAFVDVVIKLTKLQHPHRKIFHLFSNYCASAERVLKRDCAASKSALERITKVSGFLDISYHIKAQAHYELQENLFEGGWEVAFPFHDKDHWEGVMIDMDSKSVQIADSESRPQSSSTVKKVCVFQHL